MFFSSKMQYKIIQFYYGDTINLCYNFMINTNENISKLIEIDKIPKKNQNYHEFLIKKC